LGIHHPQARIGNRPSSNRKAPNSNPNPSLKMGSIRKNIRFFAILKPLVSFRHEVGLNLFSAIGHRLKEKFPTRQFKSEE
jgi:hypothetical protein